MTSGSTYPLKEAAKPTFLAQFYRSPALEAVQRSINDFLPYATNFPGSKAVVVQASSRGPAQLVLDCVINVRRNSAAAVASGGGSGMPLHVSLSFPAQYPSQVVQATLELTDHPAERVKQPYAVMGSDRRIQVECLTFLRGVERPFALLDVLVAISEQFELDYPLVGSDYRPPPTAQDAARMTSNAISNSSNPSRAARIQEVSEKVVIDLNEKASNYLDTREQSLLYLQKLNESNRELQKAKEVLTRHKAELQGYLPSLGDVSVLLRQLESHENTIEEHSNCLVAEDPLQARALELMAEIHASEDTLALLEDGLKAEQLTCEDYVKYVSDVGREQFMARFLCQRILGELSKNSGGASGAGSPTPGRGTPRVQPATPSRPAVPSRLSPQDALKTEFGSIDADVIRDVLGSCNGDINTARQQLRAMIA